MPTPQKISQFRTYAKPLHVEWAVPTLLLAVAFKSAICVSSELWDGHLARPVLFLQEV